MAHDPMADDDIIVRRLVDADIDAMVRNDLRAFGVASHPAGIDRRVRNHLELDRFVVAEHRGRIVGNAGAYSFELTLPGGATVPVCGVTWVAVAPTHRRRGVMRSLLAAVHLDAAARGEVASILWASEGAIYQNVGYGPLHTQQIVSVEKKAVRWRNDVPRGGSVYFAEPGEARDLLPQISERERRLRAGGLRRSDHWWGNVLSRVENEVEGEPTRSTLIHVDDDDRPDGYAVFSSDGKWDDDLIGNVVTVELFAAETNGARAELWRVLTSLDLMRRFGTDLVSIDDPLRWWLVDGRAVATTAQLDGVWLRVLDVGGLFGARTYAADDTIVVDAGELGRWSIGSGGCRPSDVPADVELSPAMLGAVSLGGMSVAMLVRAGRIREVTAGAARRLDAMLVVDPLPFFDTFF